MIYFLVDYFDIKIDANALPTAATEETISEETVRIRVVGRLLDEFKDNFDDPLGELFADRMEGDSGISAAIEANSRLNSLARQTQMGLEQNSGGFDVQIEAKLPRLLDLIPVDRQNYSEHLLLKVNELHSNRYGEVLERHSTVDICAKLENSLTPGVRLVSDGGLFSLDGLRSISGDIKTTAAGIYMHILWSPNDPQNFCLYVGQAKNLRNRITDHNDMLYRRKHPSLHYHVWDSQEDMCSEFVILAVFNSETEGHNLSRYEQCLLNLLEMWMACLFRTLTAKDLDTYLPPSADRSSPGRHLNIVPPIWQRFHDENLPARKEVFGRAGFEALIRSDDPAVRSWARQATASYNDLRNSPDPRLRRYWFEDNQRQLQKAWDANEKRAIDGMKAYQVGGKERTIRCAPGRKIVNIIFLLNIIL
ncbi:unnamed protein product [Penicillium viridicatum]